MKAFDWQIVTLAFLAIALGACSTDPSCSETATCPAPGGVDASTDVSVSGDAGGADGDGLDVDGALSDSSLPSDGGDEPKPEAAPPCDKDAAPAEAACVTDDKYGVFVSPKGDDTAGLGTKAAPYKTFAKAIADAKVRTKRVYACDDSTGYPESITIGASLDGIAAYGGFDCATWTYSATAKAVVKPVSGAALKVSALTTGITFENFEFDSADATTAGTSSIAVTIDTAQNVVFRNVKMVAGKGGDGTAGVDGAKGADGVIASPQKQGAPAACGASTPTSQVGGGWTLGEVVCGSRGGNGGTANQSSTGTPGSAGTPTTNVNPPNINNRGTEGDTGGDGAPGSAGNAGTAGSAAPTIATFGSTGYTAAGPGGDGKVDGFPGQGGGGGGASNATGTCIGASGGAGGMGGCGGKLGTGGGSGGASVALLVWTSGVSLTGCELRSASGGAGGKGGSGGAGGKGQDGAVGGQGISSPTVVGAGGKGGKGGDGGAGSPGAGGNGGPSYALVFNGTEPVQTSTTLTPGAGGAKGAGGTAGTVPAPDGTTGAAQQKLQAP